MDILESLHNKKAQLAIKLDLSKRPDMFNRLLRVTGIYLYGRAFREDSLRISELELEMILYNKIDMSEIEPPEDSLVFRLRDLQEFPYCAAVRIAPPEKN